jgi:hypothetical protein
MVGVEGLRVRRQPGKDTFLYFFPGFEHLLFLCGPFA